jgi:thiol:disulfide interchange protein DsbD
MTYRWLRNTCPLAVAAVLILPGGAAVSAQQDDLFNKVGKALREPARPKQDSKDDPFSPENEIKEAPRKPGVRKINTDPIDRLITFQGTIEPGRGRRGQTVKLTLTGTPAPGYHTYALTKRADDPADEGFAPKWIYRPAAGLQPLWPVTETEPVFERVESVGWFLEHKGPFTWTQDILILPDAQPGLKRLLFTIKLQVCNERGCTPGEAQFEALIDVSDESAAALAPELQDRLKIPQPGIQAVGIPGMTPAPLPKAEAQGGGSTEPKRESVESGMTDARKVIEGGLLAFLLQAVGFGAISLLTPCVFPMIPITVSYFLKQSEKQHHRAITMALVYSGTIVVVLAVGGVLLMKSLQGLSQHWATNYFLGILFLIFALSLFGMFELQLPSGLANLTSAREGQGGLAGTIFMALTFTIISFTCVAPFYGGFIGLSASAQTATDWFKLGAASLAFSITFASPFIVLALFPSLLRKMPKSGSWLNTIKVVMGFLELAAALKFLRAGELVLFNKADFLSYDLVLGMYVALALLCGLYLLNVYRLPHDTPVEHLGVPRLLFSLAFLSLGFYLMPGLFKLGSGENQRPTGKVFAWLDSFLLPDENEGEPGPAAAPGKSAPERPVYSSRLPWIGNLSKGLEEARDRGKLVFVDFTGKI